MKKIVLSVAAILAAASLAYGASIVGSNHDMTTNGYGDNTKTDEICVYCHTPHNAAVPVPLWNRVNPSPQQLYNSVTLTTEAKTAAFTNDSISAFCMSCHDGSTKVGAIKNLPQLNTKGADSYIATGQDFGKAVTNYAGIGQATDVAGGNSLKNDHPIGFSYALAAAQDDAESKTGGLHTIAEVKSAFSMTGSYQPFFAANGKTDTMECASCHKVHDPGTSYNFLRKENTGSALCLACHNK